MVDYRKFLGRSEAVVAPLFGGPLVHLGTRVLRLPDGARPNGWYRLAVTGRVVHIEGPADPPPLQQLPLVRGWYLDERVVHEQARAELLHFLPGDEIPRLAPVTARRWHSGHLLFEGHDFESEVEGAVREALANGLGLSAVKGVAAPLRAAAGYVLLKEAGARLNIPFGLDETRRRAGAVAEKGPLEAEEALRALVVEREETQREWQALQAARAAAALAEQVDTARQQRHLDRGTIAGAMCREATKAAASPVDRAREALEGAGALVDSVRRLDNGARLEVSYRYQGQRFVSVADAATLQVQDAGICLGHPPRDDLVTLESLPGVIQEAIDDGVLVVTRFA